MTVCDVIAMRAKDGRSPRQIFSAAEISQMIHLHLLTTPRQLCNVVRASFQHSPNRSLGCFSNSKAQQAAIIASLASVCCRDPIYYTRTAILP